MSYRQIIEINERNRKHLIEMGLVREAKDGRLIGVSDTINTATEQYLNVIRKQRMRF